MSESTMTEPPSEFGPGFMPSGQLQLGRLLPGRQLRHRLEGSRVRLADRLRIVPAHRPDRRARTVRRVLPRRGPAAARAPRPPARPRRRRPARRADRAGRPRRGDHQHRAGRHPEHHLQRSRRPGPPAVHPGPALRRPRRLEHRHHRQRLDRRQLPPRRLPRPRGPVHPRRGLRGNRQADLGRLGRRRHRRLLRPARVVGGAAPSAGCSTPASTTPWTSRRGCRAAPSTGRCCSRPETRPRAGTSPPARRTSSSPRTRSSTTPWTSAATSWSARSRPAAAPTT